MSPVEVFTRVILGVNKLVGCKIQSRPRSQGGLLRAFIALQSSSPGALPVLELGCPALDVGHTSQLSVLHDPNVQQWSSP